MVNLTQIYTKFNHSNNKNYNQKHAKNALRTNIITSKASTVKNNVYYIIYIIT